MTSSETPPQGQADGAATGSGEAELRALLEKATPGPWHVHPKAAEEWFFEDVNILRYSGLAVAVAVHNGDIEPDTVVANAALIVAAVNTLPRHLDEIAHLKVRVEELERMAASLKSSLALNREINVKLEADLSDLQAEYRREVSASGVHLSNAVAAESRLAASEAENARKTEALEGISQMLLARPDIVNVITPMFGPAEHAVFDRASDTLRRARQALSTNATEEAK